MVSDLDADGSGEIDFEEFLDMMTPEFLTKIQEKTKIKF